MLLSWEGGFLPGASCLALLELSPLFSPRNARALQRSTRQRTGPFPAPWLHCPGGGALLVLCWLVCGVALILDQHWVLPPEQLKPAGPCWAPPWDASQLLVPDASLGTPGAFRGSFPSLPLPSAGTRCPGMEMTSSTAQSPAPRYRTRQLCCRIVGCAGRGEGGWQLAGTWTGARAGVDHSGTVGDGGGCASGTEAPRVSAQCFAVRSLGWVEIPEEDLAPGKSSIAVNNCIQQLSNSKGQGSAENQAEVRAWDGAARQGPIPGLLLLRLEGSRW